MATSEFMKRFTYKPNFHGILTASAILIQPSAWMAHYKFDKNMLNMRSDQASQHTSLHNPTSRDREVDTNWVTTTDTSLRSKHA